MNAVNLLRRTDGQLNKPRVSFRARRIGEIAPFSLRGAIKLTWNRNGEIETPGGNVKRAGRYEVSR